jgi:hypothetical protein
MKQGTGKSEAATKVEPTSHAVNPEAVSQLGREVVQREAPVVYQGPGLSAPMVSSTTHKTGSQGEH